MPPNLPWLRANLVRLGPEGVDRIKEGRNGPDRFGLGSQTVLLLPEQPQ